MNRLYLGIFLVFCLAGAVSSASVIRSWRKVVGTPFTDCGSKGATIVNITVAGCDTLPCHIKGGSNVSFSMNFKATQDIPAATVEVFAFLGPIKVPFTPPDTNACNFMKCPIKNGDSVNYKQALAVPTVPPGVKVQVQWELTNSGEILTCFAITAETM